MENFKCYSACWKCHCSPYQCHQPPKKNLFDRKQMMTPRVCSGVDVSLSLPRLPCASEALSVPSQLYPGQDKSRALCDWHGSISLESCLTHSSVCMLAGFSAVCFHVLHFGVVNASLLFYFRGNYAVCGSWMISWKYKKSEQNSALMQSEDVITGLDDCSSSYSFLRKRVWPCCIPLHKLLFSYLGSNDSWVELAAAAGDILSNEWL